MALGGGTFTSQNKELPGAYINFAASASAALSDRGIATMPLDLAPSSIKLETFNVSVFIKELNTVQFTPFIA